ncbi:MAG: molybdopterin biosynthesis protein [Chloroflexi bacterium]|nr:molybdopterin biosynthesis protein [Chloroflexota bacterium]
MPHREIYLEDIPLEDALKKFWSALDAVSALAPLPAEPVDVEAALGRVTAEPVFARLSVPHYHAAAMDGIAVRADDTLGASETNPVHLQTDTQAIWVDTGDPLPHDTNAVIMAEQVQDLGDGRLEIMAAVAPWQHVRSMGEDLVATELVLPENHVLSAVDLGAATAAGHTCLHLRRRPRVAILPTGSELVEAGRSPLPAGAIVDFNSVVLAGQVREWGGAPTRLPITPDERGLILARVDAALGEYDVVIVNAGSSAGSEDYTAGIVRELGDLLVHGVAIRPGHPLVLGVAQSKPLIGLPGYPVSAILTSELFLKPLLYRLQGLPTPPRPTTTATITRKLLSPMGEEEYVRVKLGQVGERLVAAPLSRGAGVIMSMVRADGLVRIPRFSEGVHAGGEVDVELLRSMDDIRKTVVCIGSHDLALDLLSNALARRTPGASLASANVGSLGGLLALARGEAHLAGSHLLDEATGEYNVSYIQRHLAGVAVVLVHLAGRVQGLILPKGNPRGLRVLEDLAQPGIQFVNRQRGSGTRVLLDYRLRQLGITAETIGGYEREQYTHLAVAADVAGGAADVGLGILAAARALDLDFVPLFNEQYQLVIPRHHYESDVLAPVLSILADTSFQSEVNALGGYDVADMGTVIWRS